MTAPPRGIIGPSSELFPVNRPWVCWPHPTRFAGHTRPSTVATGRGLAGKVAGGDSPTLVYPSRYSFTRPPCVQEVSRARRSTRRILAEVVLGSSANSIRRMRWYGARLR